MAITMARPGIINATSDGSLAQDHALFLVEFGGLILNLFEAQTLMRNLHTVIPLAGAKSFDFPVVGRATGSYHTAGGELTGQAIKHGTRNIACDPLLTTDVLIDKLDDVLNYYPVRELYANELAYFLAKTFDEHCFLEVVRGATDSGGAVNSGDKAMDEMLTGTVYKNVKFYNGTDAEKLAALLTGLKTVGAAFDKANVPKSGRYCILEPDLYWGVIAAAGASMTTSSIVNKDVNGSGSVAAGTFGPVFGFEILMSNLMPYANYSGDSGNYKYHQVNSLGTRGLCFQRSAIGSVSAIDVNVDMFERKELRAIQMVAEYAMGHGVLRPEACAQLSGVAA